jgi:hypothetical protein
MTVEIEVVISQTTKEASSWDRTFSEKLRCSKRTEVTMCSLTAKMISLYRILMEKGHLWINKCNKLTWKTRLPNEICKILWWAAWLMWQDSARMDANKYLIKTGTILHLKIMLLAWEWLKTKILLQLEEFCKLNLKMNKCSHSLHSEESTLRLTMSIW